MPCYNPIRGARLPDGSISFSFKGSGHEAIDVPCGGCLGCRLQRASDWALRCVHEAQLHPVNSAVTLTYRDEDLPSSLKHDHFVNFMRRLRHSHKTKNIRYYMCGEYGEQFNRPHFHSLIFNYEFPDRLFYKTSGSGTHLYTSSELQKLWPYGHSIVGHLDYQTAHYIARYCFAKITGDQAASHYGDKVPEYNQMSRRPGIGSAWLDKYRADVFPCDYVIHQGAKHHVPKYYDRLNKRHNERELGHVKSDRADRAQQRSADNTEERLRVKLQVETARQALKTRN